MFKMIHTYSIFTKTTFKQDYMAYKSRFLLWGMSNLILIFVQIFLWVAIFNSSQDVFINGFDKNQMINYIIISKIIESLTFASIENKIAQDYNDGKIAMSLIKPIDYRKEILFRTLGVTMGSLVLFTPIYLIIYIFFNMTSLYSGELIWLKLLTTTPLICIAFLMNFYISSIFSSLVFRTIKSSGLYELKKTVVKLLSGALFPIVFYPSFISKSLNYLPFIYLRYIPVTYLQGKHSISDSIQTIIIGLIWLIVLKTISNYLWNKQIKKIVIFGG